MVRGYRSRVIEERTACKKYQLELVATSLQSRMRPGWLDRNLKVTRGK